MIREPFGFGVRITRENSVIAKHPLKKTILALILMVLLLGIGIPTAAQEEDKEIKERLLQERIHC